MSVPDPRRYADQFVVAGHNVFVEASYAPTDGSMFRPFRFLVVKDGRVAFVVALEQNPMDRSLFLFALHDGLAVSLVGGGLRQPFDYGAAKLAAIPIIERVIAARMSAYAHSPAPPTQPAWQPQQHVVQQHTHASAAVQPPMQVWGTAVAPKPLFVGGFRDAIFHGAGFLNPRLSGLAYLAAGALCAGGTYALVHLAGIIFIYPAALATGMGLPGLFMVVTGEPKARPGDESHPILVRVGLVLSFMVGSIGGLFSLQYYL